MPFISNRADNTAICEYLRRKTWRNKLHQPRSSRKAPAKMTSSRVSMIVAPTMSTASPSPLRTITFSRGTSPRLKMIIALVKFIGLPASSMRWSFAVAMTLSVRLAGLKPEHRLPGINQSLSMIEKPFSLQQTPQLLRGYLLDFLDIYFTLG